MVRRAALCALSAALASGAFANRVLETSVDDLLVCYEDHPSRTVVSYVEGDYVTFVLDANKSGELDSKDDRVVTFAHGIRNEYYPDGILETRLLTRPDGSFALSPDVFFGPVYVNGGKVFDTQVDEEAYDAARLRFELESERLARIEDSLDDARPQLLVSCDVTGVFGFPSANRF